MNLILPFGPSACLASFLSAAAKLDARVAFIAELALIELTPALGLTACIGGTVTVVRWGSVFDEGLTIFNPGGPPALLGPVASPENTQKLYNYT